MSFFNQFQLKDFQFTIVEQTSLDLDAITLFPEELQQFNALHNTKRKIEFLGGRHLRNTLEIKHPIQYSKSGKPYIEGTNLKISISHCPGWISLVAAPYPIGIDIELEDRNALKIINKFATEDEKILCFDATQNWALDLWCAKEAIYKLYDIQGLSFKEEIQIQSKDKSQDLILLKGCITRANDNPEFEVRICKQNKVLLAVALFKAEP